jgi:phosphoribosyl-ATP pyrophosphohydrolase/phosphoribosyl-AMP cyclohydrolase
MSTTDFQTSNIDFEKAELVPAVIQDESTSKVLMLGYMNKEAVDKTLDTKKVTFYSRSKQRLWIKGEESGNFLNLKSIQLDCDSDALLIQVTPEGPTCHKGTDTCWGEDNQLGTLDYLEKTIKDRRNNPDDKSYVSSLFKEGINKIAQKVGEEAVEIVIEAKDDNEELFLNEGADLLFHYLILLEAKGYGLKDILKVLDGRVK